MKPTPETDKARADYQQEMWNSFGTSDGRTSKLVPVEFARKLERERDEARQFAEHYRAFWERVEAAIDDCPNGDPLPWVFKAQHTTPDAS